MFDSLTRIVRHLVFTLGIMLPLAACQQNAASGAQTAAQSTRPAEPERVTEGPAFRLSTQAPPRPEEPDANWCKSRDFKEHLVINAEKEQTNRRYFYLPNGVAKLAVGPTGAFATLMLRPEANGDVEVFTGANFPACLSAPMHISPATGGPVLHFDNHHNVQFSMELREDGGHLLVTVVIPPAGTYVIMADHCRNCQ